MEENKNLNELWLIQIYLILASLYIIFKIFVFNNLGFEIYSLLFNLLLNAILFMGIYNLRKWAYRLGLTYFLLMSLWVLVNLSFFGIGIIFLCGFIIFTKKNAFISKDTFISDFKRTFTIKNLKICLKYIFNIFSFILIIFLFFGFLDLFLTIFFGIEFFFNLFKEGFFILETLFFLIIFLFIIVHFYFLKNTEKIYFYYFICGLIFLGLIFLQLYIVEDSDQKKKLAEISEDKTICSKIISYIDRNYCYFHFGINFDDLISCEHISYNSVRERCYESIALSRLDINICTNLKEKANCVREVYLKFHKNNEISLNIISNLSSRFTIEIYPLEDRTYFYLDNVSVNEPILIKNLPMYKIYRSSYSVKQIKTEEFFLDYKIKISYDNISIIKDLCSFQTSNFCNISIKLDEENQQYLRNSIYFYTSDYFDYNGTYRGSYNYKDELLNISSIPVYLGMNKNLHKYSTYLKQNNKNETLTRRAEVFRQEINYLHNFTFKKFEIIKLK